MKWVSLSCSFSEQFVSATGSKSFRIQLLLLSVLGFHLLGCAPSLSDAKPPFDSPLAITAQPQNQTVPLGLAATFSVNVTGSPIQYQWNRNGSPIPGATGSTYTIPATVTTDAGSIFTVTVSNNTFGKVTSSPTSLTLTGRAPKAGDLRFQQVDAAFTLNGYDDGGTSETTLSGRYIYHYGGTGTPLFLGPGHCLNSPLTDGVGCSWEFQQFQLPSNISTPGIQYASDFYSNLVPEKSGFGNFADWQAIVSQNPVFRQ